MTRWLRSRPLVLAIAGILVASCTGQSASLPPPRSPAQSYPQGGTLRIVVPPGNFTDELAEPQPTSLDPQLGNWFGVELWRCCLVRTLYSYNGLPTEQGGSRLSPDLATAMPEVSPDGLTWTVRIKPGLHFGPPLEAVEITARDFVRSFERLLAPRFAEVGWFFGPYLAIVGASEYNSGEAANISGLEAPDDHTLVFHLTEPAGDFGARLAVPATGPLPPDPLHPHAAFGIAEGGDAGIGRYLVSSGPYIVEGSKQLDFSVPADQRRPTAGFAKDRLTLVRNPSWDPMSDALRPAYADRIEIVPVDSVERAVEAIDAGAADLVWPSWGKLPTLPPDVFAEFQADPARGTVHLYGESVVHYVVLNVAVPPFDDLHVRTALDYAIDKQSVVDLQGGPVAAEVQRHGVADSLEDDLLADYDPHATPGDRGDLAAARAEMAESKKYDRDGDGRCDAPACEHIRAWTSEPYGQVAAAVAHDLESLGIGLEVESINYQTFIGPAHPELRVPLLIGLGFAPPYFSGAGYLQLGNDSRLSFAASVNWTMVGATAEQLRGWGYEVTKVQNVDAEVGACVPLVGAAQFRCVADVDMYLTEHLMAYVPLTRDRYAALASPRVLHYGFDEQAGTTALDQIALKP